MQAHKPIAVFLGPSLPLDEAQKLLDADYYPPVRRGDVYRLLPTGIQTIVIIDGVFHSSAPVWQREILEAIEQGVRVIGASSMGAVRAAELCSFGMIGHGTIFEWYRDAVIDGDDEVALVHGGAEAGYRALSEPLVNIRSTLARAVEDGCLEASEADELIAYAKGLHYPQRTYRQLLSSPVLQRAPLEKIERLEQYFLTQSVNVKMQDAMGALRLAAERPAGRKFNHGLATCAFHQGSPQYARAVSGGFIGAHVVNADEILRQAREDTLYMKRTRTALSRRAFLREWAAQNDVSAPKEFVSAYITRWQNKSPVADRSEWLRANQLAEPVYLNLLAQRALAEWLMEQRPAFFGLRHGFIVDWAAANGVSLPLEFLTEGATDQTLESWIIEQGPAYFGLNWNFDIALLEELQVTGRVAEFTGQMEAAA